MIVFPKAKINLGLRITGKRDDGYHNIETVFYPVSLNDALEFVITDDRSEKDYLVVTGIPLGVITDDNIVMKALGKLRENHIFPRLRIHLHKAIPHGAGLGGGSSDAACLMKSLNRFFCLQIPEAELKSLALEIGSDCPFFIEGEPSFATGRGEILQPVSPVLEGYYLVLVNPGLIINTAEAYRNCRPADPGQNLMSLVGRDISDWKNHVLNDFEDYAFSEYPLLRNIKNELYDAGALFSLMSGSGSSLYGIFPHKPARLPDSIGSMIIYQGGMQ